MEPIRADEGRTLGGLFRQLSHDIGTLLRQESELARAEIGAKFTQASRGAGALGAGALIAYAGLLFLMLAATLALGDAFDSLPLGALVVGAVAALVGGGLIAKGRGQLKTEELKPTRTIESLRKDAELVRDGAASHPHH
jgi:hypothetical protein